MLEKNTGSGQQRERGRWDQSEHTLFLIAIMRYGKQWKGIQSMVKTRTVAQVRSHAQKFFLSVKKMLKIRKHRISQRKELPAKSQLLREKLMQIGISPKTPPQILAFLGSQSPQQASLDEPHQNAQTAVNGILAEADQQQSSSFFLTMMKQKRAHFASGGQFSELIDMPSETQLEDHETKRRKKSFTNYEEDFPLREVGE